MQLKRSDILPPINATITRSISSHVIGMPKSNSQIPRLAPKPSTIPVMISPRFE